ncbi:hypothetical protein Syun_021547 [Stephania yunnanensis]|uniref:Uncharacterized protein n=1 Tax=Stephania yunnanensis TaxID=152371 RepID=A0AAP0IGK8_9MAGN
MHFAGSVIRPISEEPYLNLEVVIFGGLVDKQFLGDLTVYDAELLGLAEVFDCEELAIGLRDDRLLILVKKCLILLTTIIFALIRRDFHVAVAIDCHIFIFGGRYGGKRYRGWDGKKWLSDVYVLDTISELAMSGSLPPPRCGHTVTMVEKRLLVFGGRGSKRSYWLLLIGFDILVFDRVQIAAEQGQDANTWRSILRVSDGREERAERVSGGREEREERDPDSERGAERVSGGREERAERVSGGREDRAEREERVSGGRREGGESERREGGE